MTTPRQAKERYEVFDPRHDGPVLMVTRFAWRARLLCRLVKGLDWAPESWNA